MARPPKKPAKTAPEKAEKAPKLPKAVRESAPVLTGDTGLAQYLAEIRKFPLLEPQQEIDLARAWRDSGDRDAVQQLVTSHLRLVAKIAMGYRGYGLPVTDLIAEGNLGMMQAVKKFDPERGFRLSTYAMWWIKASIQEYILRTWSLVKIGTTAAQKKLFFNLRRIKNDLRAYEDADLHPDQVRDIADQLAVPEHEVVSMNRRLGAPDHSLNATVGSADEGSSEWQDFIPDTSANQENTTADSEEWKLRQELFRNALAILQPRERHILAERRLREPPSTLEDLSQHYNISRERVRQIENRAFEKLREEISKQLLPKAEERKALPKE